MRTLSLIVSTTLLAGVSACKKDAAPEAAPVDAPAAEAPADPPEAAEAPVDPTPSDIADGVVTEPLSVMPRAAFGVVLSEDLITGRLILSATQVEVGTPVKVIFAKNGLNGCYEQSFATTTTEGTTWTHAYTTAHVGEVCTANIPLGGFEATVTPTAPGTWTGRIVVDGDEAITYEVTARPKAGQ